MIIHSISENKLINQIGFELNCFNRPRIVAYESYRSNSSYLYLLFADIANSNFNPWGISLEEFFAKEAKLNFNLKLGNIDGSENEISSAIDQQKYIIIITNHFYNSLYSDYYQKIHYAHYILIKGIENDEYLVIDEDPNEISKRVLGWKYSERNINKNKLLETLKLSEGALNIEGFDFNKHFAYFEMQDLDPNHSVSMDRVFELYKNLTRENLANIGSYIDVYSQALNKVIENFQNFDSNDSNNFIPDDLSVFLSRYDSLVLQRITLSSIFGDKVCKIADLFSKLEDTYLIIKSIFRKAFFAKKTSLIKKVLDVYLPKLLVMEKDLLNGIDLFFANGLNNTLEQSKADNLMQLDNCRIDVSEYCNNKVFGENGDISGFGEYIETDGSEVLSFEYDGKKVEIPLNRRFDNVTCEGQTIEVNVYNAVNIVLVGFCSVERTGDYITINYDDNTFEKAYIRFSNYALDPLYNEIILRKGTARIKESNAKFDAYLYLQKFHIQNGTKRTIKSLALPENTNIHIFNLFFECAT